MQKTSKQQERQPQEQETIQRFGELETNPISLPEEYCKQAIEQLMSSGNQIEMPLELEMIR